MRVAGRQTLSMLAARKSHGRMHEGDVGEGLREVAGQSRRIGVVFLREKTYIVGQAEQLLEELRGLGNPAQHGVNLHQPEAARNAP